jgi:UDP-glucuronate 4-epimerase
VVALLEKQLGPYRGKVYAADAARRRSADFADISDLLRDTGVKPEISIADEIAEFAAWYRSHYRV